MNLQIRNLHNHTPFSDGAYEIDELCEFHLSHKSAQIAGIGITDSLFCTPSSREVADAKAFQRLFAKETRAYVEHVHEARRRWAGRIDVYCGCEINWPLNKQHTDAIRELLNGIDYVLFEFVDWAGLTTLANQARRWPCPIGLSQSVITQRFPTTSTDQVVRTMSNARIFHELSHTNLAACERDGWLKILPRHRVPIIIGTDTHDDLAPIDQIGLIVEAIERHGLEDKLLELPPRTAGVQEPSATPVRSATG